MPGSSRHSEADAAIQARLQELVNNDVAPAWTAAYVKTDGTASVLTAGVSDIDTMAPLREDALWTYYSASKLLISLALFRALEQSLIDGLSLDKLDDATALSRWLPELSLDAEPLHDFMKIFEGWEDVEHTKARLRPAKVPVTLRHLLTFSAGSCGDFFDKDALDLQKLNGSPARPSNESLRQPRHAEAGSYHAFGYAGPAQDFIGILLARALGKTQREIVRQLVLDPLGISHNDVDYAATDAIAKRMLPVWSREADGSWKQSPSSTGLETWVDGVPKGHHERSNSAFLGTVPAYLRILQACITRSPALISTKAWDMLFTDSLPSVDTVLPDPLVPASAFSEITREVPLEHADAGISMFQAVYERHASIKRGFSPGTVHWVGLLNFFWWIDQAKGIAGLVATQAWPFYDPALVHAAASVQSIISKQA